MMMMMMLVSCTCLFVMTNRNQIHAAPLNDLISDLPGYGRPPTPHFSGYLDASEGCDTAVNGPICNIHYWLALAADTENEHEHEHKHEDEATRSSNDDSKSKTATTSPTVLWLNGGP